MTMMLICAHDTKCNISFLTESNTKLFPVYLVYDPNPNPSGVFILTSWLSLTTILIVDCRIWKNSSLDLSGRVSIPDRRLQIEDDKTVSSSRSQ